MLNQFLRYSPVINFLKKKSGSILEVGSGSQGLGKFYHRKFTGLDMTTSDYSIDEKTTNPYMTFVRGSCLELPFLDSSFSTVFSLDMIEHLKPLDRTKAISEMIRVSKEYVVIAFPCDDLAYHFDSLLQSYLQKLKKPVPGRLSEHLSLSYPTFKEISQILDNINCIQWKYDWNSNIWFWSFVIYIETFVKGGSLFGVFLLHILKFFSCSFNNSYGGYRLFIYIKKGK